MNGRRPGRRWRPAATAGAAASAVSRCRWVVNGGGGGARGGCEEAAGVERQVDPAAGTLIKTAALLCCGTTERAAKERRFCRPDRPRMRVAVAAAAAAPPGQLDQQLARLAQPGQTEFRSSALQKPVGPKVPSSSCSGDNDDASIAAATTSRGRTDLADAGDVQGVDQQPVVEQQTDQCIEQRRR